MNLALKSEVQFEGLGAKSLRMNLALKSEVQSGPKPPKLKPPKGPWAPQALQWLVFKQKLSARHEQNFRGVLRDSCSAPKTRSMHLTRKSEVHSAALGSDSVKLNLALESEVQTGNVWCIFQKALPMPTT